MNFRHFFAVLAAAALPLFATAENLPADHPSAAVVKTYLNVVVKQDWKAAADMLVPASLERRKMQMIESVKNSRTMTEEAAKLNLLGIKDIRDLDKFTPQEAYVAEKKAVHQVDSRTKANPEELAHRIETLKINILGLVPEEGGKIVHALVRTRQETLDASIEELLLISLTQDRDDAKKWFVVPDMQVPITTPLKKEEAPKPAKP